jgi:MoaA/NifB/PqqE/SkfB family radical SAM enzyme
MCHVWKNKIGFMKIELFKRMISNLVNYVDAKNTKLLISGGEPLLNKELIEFLRVSSSLGFEPELTTNGWLLDKRMSKNIIDSGIKTIMISLDSADEKVHDAIRGRKGSYTRIMEGIGYLHHYKEELKKEVSIGITCTINSLNFSTIRQLVTWADNDPKVTSLFLQPVTQVFNTGPIENWQDDLKYSFLWPKDKKEITELYIYLIKKKESGSKIINSVSQLAMNHNYFLFPGRQSKQTLCGMLKGIIVYANGDVVICPRSKPLWNINDIDFDIASNLNSFVAEQSKIISCKVKNCQYDINCTFK